METTTQDEITYKIKVDDSNLEQDLEQVNTKISSAANRSKEEILEITKETKKGIKKQTKKILENVEEKAEQVAEAWQDSGKEIEKTAKNATETWKNSAKDIEATLSNISDPEIKISMDTSALEEEANTVAGNIMGSFQEAAGDEFPLINRISSFTEGLPGVKAKIIGAVAAVATESVSLADNMQSAMNDFLSTTGKSQKETEKYQQILESIYQNNYGESFEDISESMATVANTMGEMDDASLQEMTESALALRDTFGIDVLESVQTAKTLMEDYGMSSEEAMNTIAAGAQNGMTSSEELFAALGEGFSATGEEMKSLKENQGEDLSSMFGGLMRSVELLLVPIGESLIPLLMTLTESVLPVLQQLLEPLAEIFSRLLEPIVNVITTAMEPLIEIIFSLMDMAIMPLVELIEKILVPIFTNSLQGLASDTEIILGNIKNVFTNIVDFVKNVLTGNWEGAWKNIKNIFKSIVENWGVIFKSPINSIIDAINGFIKGLNQIKIPDWVPAVGGKGFKLPKIPRLKVGMDYVPSDFFPAFLDEGEAVLTKEENAIFRTLGGLEGMAALSVWRGQESPVVVQNVTNIDYELFGQEVYQAFRKHGMSVSIERREFGRVVEEVLKERR